MRESYDSAIVAAHNIFFEISVKLYLCDILNEYSHIIDVKLFSIIHNFAIELPC